MKKNLFDFSRSWVFFRQKFQIKPFLLHRIYNVMKMCVCVCVHKCRGGNNLCKNISNMWVEKNVRVIERYNDIFKLLFSFVQNMDELLILPQMHKVFAECRWLVYTLPNYNLVWWTCSDAQSAIWMKGKPFNLRWMHLLEFMLRILVMNGRATADIKSISRAIFCSIGTL